MKTNSILTAAAICAALNAPAAFAEWNDSIRYRGELSVSLGGGEHNPFWLMNDRNGLASPHPNSGFLRLGAFHDLDKQKRFSWGAGIDVGVSFHNERIFLPQQLYGEVQWRCLDLMVGLKEIPDPVVNSDLSSGALTFAGNASPIPQVRAGIFDYADFWGCKGWFAVKGHNAYGMFMDNSFINHWVDKKADHPYSKDVLYCSRAIYFRGGNPDKFPLWGELGLNMETQFGGTTYLYNPKTGETTAEKHPSYPKAWLKALIPMKGGSDTSAGEQLNVEGNMLGNWSFALQWDDPSGWNARIYYQHYFEDHSMLFFDYPWKDGLYGVSGRLPKNPYVSEICYEFLYMKDQGGPVYWDHTPDINYQVSGRDNYYNHYFYNGWSQFGMGFGNPLVLSPIYNDPHTLYFRNTRIIAHHLGFKGDPTQQVGYRVKASWLRSWGNYDDPQPHVKGNFSLLAEAKWHPAKLKGWEGTLSFAMDAGGLIGHNYGVGITITKTGWF